MDNFKIPFRLICLLIMIIFAAILNAKILKEKNENVILGYTVFFVFFSRFQFTCDLHDASNQKNNKSFDFYWNGILMQFWKICIFCKITMSEDEKIILKLTPNQIICLLWAFTVSPYPPSTKAVHSARKFLTNLLTSVCKQAFLF